MIIKKFEDIKSWQKSKELAVLVYKLLKDNRDFGFNNQIQRASVSISNNIAEGFERQSIKNLSSFYTLQRGLAAK